MTLQGGSNGLKGFRRFRERSSGVPIVAQVDCGCFKGIPKEFMGRSREFQGISRAFQEFS